MENKGKVQEFCFFQYFCCSCICFCFQFFWCQIAKCTGRLIRREVSTALRPVLLFWFVLGEWSRSPTHAGHVRGEASGTSDARVCSNLRPTANPKRQYLLIINLKSKFAYIWLDSSSNLPIIIKRPTHRKFLRIS